MERIAQCPVIYLSVILCTVSLFPQLAFASNTTGDEGEQESSLKPHPLRILIVTSNHVDVLSQNVALWERGEELVPGALLASEEINNHPDVLSGFIIEPVNIIVPNCSIESGILEVVTEIIKEKSRVVAVAGLFCNRLTEALSPLIGHRGIDLIQLSGSTALRAEKTSSDYPHLYSMLPSIEMHIGAILDLMQTLDWTKIGLLKSISNYDNYYMKAAEAFYTLKNERNRSIEILFHAEVGGYGNNDMSAAIDYLIQKVISSRVRIVVAFVTPHAAFELVCAAFRNHLTWPNYGWIFTDINTDDIIPVARCDQEMMRDAIEKVIVIRHQIEPENDDTLLVSNISYSVYTQRILNGSRCAAFNPFSNILHDSVWAMALAMNHSIGELTSRNISLRDYGPGNSEITKVIEASLIQTSFSGAVGKFIFDGTLPVTHVGGSVQIVQVRNGSSIVLRRVGANEYNTSIFNLSMLGEEIPSDEIARVYQTLPIAVTVTLTVAIALCLLFMIAVFGLFVFYRNQAEVKATSRALSLCIFLGCFLLLFSALAHSAGSGVMIIQESQRNSLCIIDISLCSLGLDLILATILAKTLRIVHIFSHYGKTGRGWSDRVLLIMILLITTGKLCMLVLWNVTDPYRIVDYDEFIRGHRSDSYYLVVQHCYSKNTGLWLAIIFTYTGLLGLVLAILAYKSRKIKRGNFKDTKKINGLIVCLLMAGCIFISLWGIFRIVEMPQGSKVVGGIGYTVLPMLCLLFLFLPKILPAIRRHAQMLKQNYLVTRNQSPSMSTASSKFTCSTHF